MGLFMFQDKQSDGMTDIFRENLVKLAKKHKCNMALHEFDSGQ